MIHRVEPKSEFDRRYAIYKAQQEQKLTPKPPKEKKKPGPKPGQPLPKVRGPDTILGTPIKLSMAAISMKLMDTP